MKTYALYFSQYCYFCQKVLMQLHDKQHQIELRSVAEMRHLQVLKNGGGKTQVPCLVIQEGVPETAEAGKSEIWLYESDDILNYLSSNKLI